VTSSDDAPVTSGADEGVDGVQCDKANPIAWFSALIASSNGEGLWPERLQAEVTFGCGRRCRSAAELNPRKCRGDGSEEEGKD
jgi:hypothetical protein